MAAAAFCFLCSIFINVSNNIIPFTIWLSTTFNLRIQLNTGHSPPHSEQKVLLENMTSKASSSAKSWDGGWRAVLGCNEKALGEFTTLKIRHCTQTILTPHATITPHPFHRSSFQYSPLNGHTFIAKNQLIIPKPSIVYRWVHYYSLNLSFATVSSTSSIPTRGHSRPICSCPKLTPSTVHSASMLSPVPFCISNSFSRFK